MVFGCQCGVSCATKSNLTRHKKQSCHGSKKEVYIPTFSGSEFGTGEPKSKETMEKIERLIQSRLIRSRSPHRNPTEERNPPLKIAILKYIKPKSLGELWCKEGKEDEEEEEEEEEQVKFLPATIEGLKKRFNTLFGERGEVENRNELVYLLDEMLRRDCISHKDFQTLNNALAQSLPGAGAGVEKYVVHSKVPPMMLKNDQEEEEEEEEEDLKSLIRSTTNYIIKQEKDKLNKLIKELKDPDEALKFETLREKVLNNHDNFEIVDDRDEIRALLDDNSSIPKSKALKFKMLLNKIQKNRYRVHAILSRLDEIVDEDRFAGTVRALAEEGLISTEQLEQLLKKDAALELQSIVNIIKEGGNPEEEEEVEEEVEEKGEGGFTKKEWEEMRKEALRREDKRREMGRLKMMNPWSFRMLHPDYIDGGFESGYYGEGVEPATAKEQMWDRRAYLLDLLKMYDKVNHKGLTDLLKDIQWVKDTISYWKDR